MNNIKQSFIAGFFSIITIGILTFLTYKTEFGVFLIASFGSSMVLLFGYPESPFAKPKNIFFGHLLTAVVGFIFLNFVPLHIYIVLPLAFRVSLPALNNNLVNLVKTTTQAMAIAVPELLYQMVSIYNDYSTSMNASMLLLFVVYIIIVAILVFGMYRWEKSMTIPGKDNSTLSKTCFTSNNKSSNLLYR